eukprot:2263497-Amphidinium_carterae.2
MNKIEFQSQHQLSLWTDSVLGILSPLSLRSFGWQVPSLTTSFLRPTNEVRGSEEDKGRGQRKRSGSKTDGQRDRQRDRQTERHSKTFDWSCDRLALLSTDRRDGRTETHRHRLVMLRRAGAEAGPSCKDEGWPC